MRINVMVQRKRATIKRIAIATRWGFESAGPPTAHLSVRDPDDEGEIIDPEESDALYVGLLRRHVANLIAPLGHGELAVLLRQLASSRFPRTIQRDLARARQVLDTTSVKEMVGGSHIDGLIGGIVTRAGPLTDSSVTTIDQQVLSRLNLRPVFVGIERDLVTSAVEGTAAAIRKRLADVIRKDDIGRFDRAGGWIVPLGPDQRLVKDI
jgi:hypothetical protein